MFFQQLSSVISLSLSVLFEIIKRTESFPPIWKVGAISPMFKSGSPFEDCNYRPITLLNVVSKVLERCIYDSVYDHCIHRISKNQHGFMKKRSIFTNLLPYLENVYRCVDERFQTVSAFYSDFAKAFDKVPHKLLLAKMHAFGIRGEALGVISSYLTNRHQFVRFDRVKSELLAVKSGVPQGSIVGPLFFIIFINDLVREIEHSLPYPFADDLKLLHTNLTDMQNDLLKFEIWVAKNGMDLQLTKCYLLNFKPQTLSIKLYGETLTCP